MPFRCPATAAAVVVLFLFVANCRADEPLRVETYSAALKSRRTDDGWRSVNKDEAAGGARPAESGPATVAASDELTADLRATDTRGSARITSDLVVAAQSPEDDAPGLTGPVWSYPSRQRPTSVPVPALEGEPDFSKRRASDRVAVLPQRRLSAASSSRTAPQADTAPASYEQNYSSGRSTFHSSPFDRGAPSCPVDSASCSPCRTSPFEDACGMGLAGYSNYSWDNIYFFTIAESFRLTDENTRAAVRSGLNWGLPIIDDDSGLGFQIGFSGSWAEEGPQWFVTSGVFYRGDMRLDSAWNVGAVFDWIQDDEFEANVAQVRGKTSITLDRKNEIGVWGAASLIDDEDNNGDTIESVNQVNLFYRYLFETDWDVTWWVGWRSDPSSVAVGISTYRPINDYWAGIFGAYYAPHGDTWNVYTGLVRHWGQRATQDYLGQDRQQPYLPVADNTSMTLFVDH